MLRLKNSVGSGLLVDAYLWCLALWVWIWVTRWLRGHMGVPTLLRQTNA